MFHHDKLHQITNAHENNKYSVATINLKTDKINIFCRVSSIGSKVVSCFGKREGSSRF